MNDKVLIYSNGGINDNGYPMGSKQAILKSLKINYIDGLYLPVMMTKDRVLVISDNDDLYSRTNLEEKY